MSKKFGSLAGLCFMAAFIMFSIGSSNSRLTELKDFFWVPIPLGIILGFLAFKKKS